MGQRPFLASWLLASEKCGHCFLCLHSLQALSCGSVCPKGRVTNICQEKSSGHLDLGGGSCHNSCNVHLNLVTFVYTFSGGCVKSTFILRDTSSLKH